MKMKTLERFIPITFKVAGVSQLLCFAAFCFGIYEPSKFSIGGNMIAIGLFLLLMEYPNKNE